MVVTVCISCGADIRLGANLRLGQHVICPVCASELEIVGLNPVELDWPYDDESLEDYDEYDLEEE